MKIELDSVDYITETSITIRGSRRRTTVPKEIVEKLDLQDGDHLRWVLLHDGSVLLVKAKRSS